MAQLARLPVDYPAFVQECAGRSISRHQIGSRRYLSGTAITIDGGYGAKDGVFT